MATFAPQGHIGLSQCKNIW